MAKTLSKSGILTGQTITAAEISQSIDALTGTEAYDLTFSGSLNLTGSIVTGSISNAATASHAITASFALNGGGFTPSLSTDLPARNITSSANISASGDLIGNQLVIGGGTFTSASLAAGGSGGGGGGTLQQVTDSGSKTTTPITASIISASFIGTSTDKSGIGFGFTGGGNEDPDVNIFTDANGEISFFKNNENVLSILSNKYIEVRNNHNFKVTGSLDNNNPTIIHTTGSIETTVMASSLNGQKTLTSSIYVTSEPKTPNHRYSGGSNNAYYLNGIESPYINFYPGKSYIFEYPAGHPLKFYENDSTGGGPSDTPYTTGVTTIGNTIQISVTETTPSILYYFCSLHEYMGNAAYLQGGSGGTTVIANPGSSGGGGLTTIGIGGTNYSIAEGGGPIQTHTSNFTSSAAFNGKYNMVGGNLTISVQTGSNDLNPAMEWNFFQTSSTNSFTFEPGPNVLLVSKNNHKKLASLGSAATLKYISGQTFHLVGDLTI